MDDEFGGHPEGQYPRSETMGRQFTTEVARTENGITGEIGTATPYAPWVVGPDYPGRMINGQTMYQARIHQGRWWQFEEIVEENADEAAEEFTETFLREFERLIRSGNK